VYHTLYSSADAALNYTTQPLLVLTSIIQCITHCTHQLTLPWVTQHNHC